MTESSPDRSATDRARARGSRAWAIDAAVLAVLRIIAPMVHIRRWGISLSQAHALCSTPLGAFAGDCRYVAAVYDVLNVITAAAVCCAVLAVISAARAAGKP